MLSDPDAPPSVRPLDAFERVTATTRENWKIPPTQPRLTHINDCANIRTLACVCVYVCSPGCKREMWTHTKQHTHTAGKKRVVVAYMTAWLGYLVFHATAADAAATHCQHNWRVQHCARPVDIVRVCVCAMYVWV